MDGEAIYYGINPISGNILMKEKIYEEINKGISENEATQAAFVIGLRLIDVYKILDEHTKYKRAVRRDKAGDDVVDTDVSRYLAEKKKRSTKKVRIS